MFKNCLTGKNLCPSSASDQTQKRSVAEVVTEMRIDYGHLHLQQAESSVCVSAR